MKKGQQGKEVQWMGQGSSWTRGEGELSEPETQGTSRLAGSVGGQRAMGAGTQGGYVECRPGQGCVGTRAAWASGSGDFEVPPL